MLPRAPLSCAKQFCQPSKTACAVLKGTIYGVILTECQGVAVVVPRALAPRSLSKPSRSQGLPLTLRTATALVAVYQLQQAHGQSWQPLEAVSMVKAAVKRQSLGPMLQPPLRLKNMGALQ